MRDNQILKPSLYEYLEEGERWMSAEKKPVCMSDNLQHFGKEHEGAETGGRMGIRNLSSLSYHLRIARLIINSGPDIFPDEHLSLLQLTYLVTPIKVHC